MFLKITVAISLFLSPISLLIGSPAGNAGKAIIEVVDIIANDDSESVTVISEGLALWIAESARIGKASFILNKDSGKAEKIKFTLASLDKLKVTVSDAELKIIQNQVYTKEAVGKSLEISVHRINTLVNRVSFQAHLVALEDFSRNEPVGSVLAAFLLTEVSTNKIKQVYKNAIDLENQGVRPRGGFGPK